ncbi:MAG: hypothetical protein J6C05_08920 [Prevotella sp.]|nr:hypothetical protein [Prevotella sp.]MBO5157230.1 hypothetical protein [Prevotella sp.]
MNIIRLITAIGRVSHLNFMVDPWHNIPIKVPAKLTISDKIDNGVRMYTVKLVFRTCERPQDIERQVYRCHCANSFFYVVGGPGRPYTITTVTDDHPDNFTDSQLYEVTVNWTSPHKIVPYI